MTSPDHGLTPASLGVGVSQGQIDQAVGLVRAFCGWHVWPVVTETLIVDGVGGVVLTLPTLKVTDVALVVESGVVLVDLNRHLSVVDDADGYEWSASGDVKRVGGCWTTRWRGIEVTLTHGFETCPLLSVVAGIASSGTAPEVVGPFSFGGSDAASSVMPYRDALSLYRIPVLP